MSQYILRSIPVHLFAPQSYTLQLTMNGIGGTAVTVIQGSTTATPAAMSGIGGIALSAVVLGSITIAPDAMVGIGGTNVILSKFTPAPISGIGDTAVGNVIQAGLTLTPATMTGLGNTGIGTIIVRTQATHWFYDLRTNGWFKDSFGSPQHDPVTVRVIEGDDPDDRYVVIGSEDGYIRFFNEDNGRDDNTPFTAYAVFGPFVDNEARRARIMLNELQVFTDNNGATLSYETMTGDTPEIAYASRDLDFVGDEAISNSGMSNAYNPRVGGRAIYVKIGSPASSDPWALDGIRARMFVNPTNRGRRRDNDSMAYSAP